MGEVQSESPIKEFAGWRERAPNPSQIINPSSELTAGEKRTRLSNDGRKKVDL